MTDLLAPSGRTAKYDTIGKTYKGVVVSRETRQQKDIANGTPKFWDSGDPMMEVVIRLQTDDRDEPGDDGIRNVYARGAMLRAIRDAVSKAQAGTVEIGGTLAIRYDRDGEASKPGFTPPKLFVAQYKPPASTPSADLLGADTPAAAPAMTADDLI